MIKENVVFEIGNKSFFYEGNKVYNAETGEVVITANSDFIEVVYDTSHYASHTEYFLLFSKKQEIYDYGYSTCDIEVYIIRKDENTPGKSEIVTEEINSFYFSSEYTYCQGPFYYDVNHFRDSFSYTYPTTYPGKDKNIKKSSKDFKKNEEPPKQDNPNNGNDSGSGKTEEPKKDDGTKDNTIPSEIKTENQFFKDIEMKNFDFKYKEIVKDNVTYMVQDNTDYQNYMANKINEFTTFFYIGAFFLLVFMNFNFIKNLLGK